MDQEEFKKLVKEHDSVLQSVESMHKNLLTSKQKKAFQEIQEKFLDKLEKNEDGSFKMNAKNLELMNQIDERFKTIAEETNPNLLKQLTSGISRIVNFNQKYYTAIDGNAKVLPILPKVQEAMSGWLGIKNGTAQKNGFIDQLISDDMAKVAVKNLAMKMIVGQKGFEEAKKELKILIEGNEDKLGAFEKHHRTFANDLYSQIDRATSNVIRQDLKFVFAVYEGGLIETSRPFCEEHNGKVFHISEIEKFKPESGIPPDYDPVHDLGGYNCRHHLNWISTPMAKAMGKDVSKFVDQKPKPESEKPKTEEKKKPEAKQDQKPEKPKVFERRPMKEDFDDIEIVKPAKFDTKQKFWKEGIDSVKTNTEKIEKGRQRINELNGKRSALYSEKSDPEATRKKIEEITEEIRKQIKENLDMRKSITKKSAEVFEKLLEGKPESSISYSSKTKYKNVEMVFGYFKKMVSKYDLEDIVVKGGAKREFYRDTEKSINISKNTSPEVIIHELIHHTENNNFILKQAVEFLMKRTEGKPIRRLKEINKGYGSEEIFKDGGFFNEYVGKIYQSSPRSIKSYKGIRATEVLTMGVQRMYENPFQFYKDDPEHFELIYELFFKK